MLNGSCFRQNRAIVLEALDAVCGSGGALDLLGAFRCWREWTELRTLDVVSGQVAASFADLLFSFMMLSDDFLPTAATYAHRVSVSPPQKWNSWFLASKGPGANRAFTR